jgi:hypothetical protein
MFLCVFSYFPFHRPSGISGIYSDPKFWIGKRICVQGVLRGSYTYIPEESHPYSYLLEELQTGCKIGITWKEGADLFPSEFVYQNVTVVGIVKKGFTGPFIVRTVCYIEAEEIKPIS